jgi:hypothetical protein
VELFFDIGDEEEQAPQAVYPDGRALDEGNMRVIGKRKKATPH